MTVANGRHMYSMPGPSVAPDRVLRAMNRPSPNIYRGELVDLTHSLVPDLKAVARTAGKVAMYIGNGHAAWEASLANLFNRGDKVLVAATGRFAHAWAEMASKRGIDVEILEFGNRSPIDPDRLKSQLAQDRTHRIKAVLTVQVDTATSAKSDMPAIRAAIDAAGHPALLLCDSIACLGCDEMQMDRWGVDVLITGCQKGLMTPPGMAFVFFNEKADAVRDSVDYVSGYWDWRPRSNAEFAYQYWCGTAPTQHVYGLREALDMIVHEEGLSNVWARHETLAQAVWTACDTWGQGGPLEMNIREASARSHAVTSVRIGAPFGMALQDWLDANMGVTLGIGLGMNSPEDPNAEGFFRIGHMGHLNGHMLLGTLASIEAGLQALGVPHGKGALQAAAEICARAVSSAAECDQSQDVRKVR